MIETTDGNLGRILKERREELGRTLQNAEEETRIRKSYLECLENNQFSELPGQAYVTGFIRVYARYLGLKSNPLLAILNDLQGVETKPAKTEPSAGSKHGQRSQQSAQGNWRKFFVLFILLLVLGCLAYFLATIFSGDEQVDESAIKASEAAETLAESRKPQAALEKLPPVPEKSQTAAPGQAQSDKSEDQRSAQVSSPSVPKKEQHEQGQRDLPTIPHNGASLRMLALADSSLIIKVDERKPHQYKLYDGLDLTWKIKQRVNVEFSTSDVARFWLNGQEIDITGDKSFTLQPAGE